MSAKRTCCSHLPPSSPPREGGGSEVIGRLTYTRFATATWRGVVVIAAVAVATAGYGTLYAILTAPALVA